MNVSSVSLVTVWQGIKGGMAHGLGHSVTVLASRHPAGVKAEARGRVRLRYARAGQFGSQRGAWAGEGTRLVSAPHRQAPIDVLCCQQAVVALFLLFNLRGGRRAPAGSA